MAAVVPKLADILIECAALGGFPLAGVVDIEPAMSGDFSKHVSKYDSWLEQGYAGAMEYLRRGRDRRADPRLVFPEAKSVFCVAIPYPRQDPQSSAGGPRYARYLQGPDYHAEIARRLESVIAAAAIRAELPDMKSKVCVDTSAVLERSWAALAGLGWIGKNTLLIHPRHGSYLFLAEALLDQATGRGPKPHPDFCGRCTRCLDACPTRAFPEPHTLDSNRCVSYLTLEHRDEVSRDPEIRKGLSTWVAGCDICQEVCPFNRKPTREALGELPMGGATQVREWMALLDESEAEYRARVSDSALKRVKPHQFRRNIAMALTSAVQEKLIPEADRPILQEKVLACLEREPDPLARAEWFTCAAAIQAEAQSGP